VFGVVALATLLGVTIYVVRTRSPVATLATVAGFIPGSLQHVHNFHWTQMKAGAQQWVLTARDANYSSDKTSVTLNDATVTMISQDGKTVVVTAPKAVLGMHGNKVETANLSGGTQIHYGDFLMTTDAMTFTPEDQVDAPGFVSIEGEGIKISGIGMTGHTRTRQFELLKQVSTYIAPRHGVAAKSKKG
jgi:LPS export ABC transporter protein LptC